MTAPQLNPLVVTLGLFTLAGVLLWRGDTAHALICAALVVPNAQQALALLQKSEPTLTAILTELQALRGWLGVPPRIEHDTPTPVPAVRGSLPTPAAAPADPPKR